MTYLLIAIHLACLFTLDTEKKVVSHNVYKPLERPLASMTSKLIEVIPYIFLIRVMDTLSNLISWGHTTKQLCFLISDRSSLCFNEELTPLEFHDINIISKIYNDKNKTCHSYWVLFLDPSSNRICRLKKFFFTSVIPISYLISHACCTFSSISSGFSLSAGGLLTVWRFLKPLSIAVVISWSQSDDTLCSCASNSLFSISSKVHAQKIWW